MASNKVIFEEDIFGFNTSKRREKEFLTRKSFKIETYDAGYFDLINPETNLTEKKPFKKIQLNIYLSEKLYDLERHRYTFVDGLSDFGGFKDGLFMLAYMIMAPYSYSMFIRSLV